MKRLALAIAFLISGIAAAVAQQNVQVIGPITQGNIPQFNSPSIIKDSGISSSAPLLAPIPANTIVCNPTSSPANAQACASPNPIVPDQFCTVDRTGATDMGACINSAIAAAKSCNNASPNPGFGRVYLRAGTYLITTPIVPKSCMSIITDGPGRTVLLTNSNAPFGPPAGQQLVHFSMDGVTFKDSGAHPGATVMTFPNIQDSRLTNLGFVGYVNGSIMSIATSLVSSFDDTAFAWNNSNSIFNMFLNWQADSCAKCIMEAGHYGTTTVSNPPGSANVPDQVVTQNRYDNISLSDCTSKCIDIIKAADTEFFTNVYLQLTNNVIGVQIGDDNANFVGYNGVSNLHMQLTISGFSPTGTTFFQIGNWTFGNVLDVVTDRALATALPRPPFSDLQTTARTACTSHWRVRLHGPRACASMAISSAALCSPQRYQRAALDPHLLARRLILPDA